MYRSSIRVGGSLLALAAVVACDPSHTSSVYSTTYSTGYSRTAQAKAKASVKAPAPVIVHSSAHHHHHHSNVQASSNQVNIRQKQIINNQIINAPVGASFTAPKPVASKPVQVKAPYQPAPASPQVVNNYVPPVPPVDQNLYAAQEERDLQKALVNSYETKSQEDQRHQNLHALEEQNMQRAIENSLQTKAEEDAWRTAAPQMQTVPVAVEATPSVQNIQPAFDAAKEEERQLQKAMEESLKTYEAETTQQQAFENPVAEPVIAPVPVVEPELPVIQPAVQEAVSEPKAWSPNEGVLVDAGARLMQYKREKTNGSVPSRNEMQGNLQRDMNLSADQANSVLDELGIE